MKSNPREDWQCRYCRSPALHYVWPAPAAWRKGRAGWVHRVDYRGLVRSECWNINVKRKFIEGRERLYGSEDSIPTNVTMSVDFK
jgi:hypothetical protein